MAAEKVHKDAPAGIYCDVGRETPFMRHGQPFESGDLSRPVSLVLRVAAGALSLGAAVRKLLAGVE